MAELTLGANLPWLDYGRDFGASAWQPDGGVAQPAQRERMRRELGRLSETGARLVRWWLLGDGRAGLRESASGDAVALDPHVFDDVDAALDALRETGLRAIFVLTDFLWFAAPSLVDGVQTGGRGRLVCDERSRADLMTRVFAPIAQRYGEEPVIAGWDLVNEPEWATLGLGTFDPRWSVSRARMRTFLEDLFVTFRAHATQFLTVGLASARWLPLVDGLGLDLYQVHWYPSQDTVETLATPVASRGLDRPLLLGEFPTKGASLSPGAILDLAQAAGYEDALAWSLLATDDATDSAACVASLLEHASEAGPTRRA